MLVPYALSRLVVLGALALSRHLLPALEVADRFRLQASLVGWDGGWYRDIARGGYDAVALEGLRYFPLFPLLGRAVAWLPGVDAALGIVVVANAAALALGFSLHALVVHERADRDLARRAVWVLYLLPPAFVLVMGYSEALFMTFATLALLGLRSRRWVLAAGASLLASVTRPVGVLLVVPALVEAVRTRERRAFAAVAAPVAGTLGYLAWAAGRSHEFLYPLRVQEDPTKRGSVIDPLRAFAHAVREVASGEHPSAGIHAVTAILLVLALAVLARRWPASFSWYAAVAIAAGLSSRNLDSLERYAFSAVPFVLAAADVTRDAVLERVVLAAAVSGLVAAAVLAFTGTLVP